ncbi:MAG: hypothetical protein GY711_24415 [bacterium]|nr:hypothetical protein [bacterium]
MSLVLVLVLVAPGAAEGAGQQTPPAAPGQTVEAGADAELTGPTRGESHARLLGLENDAFEEEAARLCAESTGFGPLEAILLRAGGTSPPGIPASRVERRVDERTDARDWIGGELQGGDTEARWRSFLKAHVTWNAAVAGGDLEMCLAALRAYAGLRDDTLGGDIAKNLKVRNPRVLAATRQALFDLYGRWFEDEAEWSDYDVTCRTAGAHAHLLSLEEERIRLWMMLLAERPLRLEEIFATLRDSDARARAARQFSTSVIDNELPLEEAVALLNKLLVSEIDATVFHALAEAAVGLVQGLSPNSPIVGSVRESLLATAEDENQEREYLSGAVLVALARLPWSENGGGDDAIASGIDKAATVFTKIEPPLFDPDQTLASLAAIRSLAGQGDGTVVLAGGVLDKVVGLLSDEFKSDEVRIAAAKTLPFVFDESEMVGHVKKELARPNTSSALLYELLGELRRAHLEFDPESEEALSLLETLREHLDDPNTDVRASALDLLASKNLSTLYEKRTELQAGWILDDLIERLGEEESADLQSVLLSLLERDASASVMKKLIQSRGVHVLAISGPRILNELVTMLGTYGNGQLMLAASKIVEDDTVMARADAEAQARIATKEVETRRARLEAALGLVTSLDAQKVAALTAAEHALIVSWAIELRGRVGAPDPKEPPVHLKRVTDVHLAQVGSELPEDIKAWHAAMLHGDLFRIDPEHGTEPALDAFAKALDLATGPDERAVRLDRARFLHAAGMRSEAFADYDALFGYLDNAIAVESWFELADLRALAELSTWNASVAVGEGRPTPADAARRAFDAVLAVVKSDPWKQEPERRRVEDLRLVVEYALASGDEPRLQGADALFRDLPDEMDETTEIKGDPLWKDLALLHHGDLLESALLLAKRAEAEVAGGTGDGGSPQAEQNPGGGS